MQSSCTPQKPPKVVVPGNQSNNVPRAERALRAPRARAATIVAASVQYQRQSEGFGLRRHIPSVFNNARRRFHRTISWFWLRLWPRLSLRPLLWPRLRLESSCDHDNGYGDGDNCGSAVWLSMEPPHIGEGKCWNQRTPTGDTTLSTRRTF